MEMLNTSGKIALPKMTLCTLLTAVLAACGGGNTDGLGAGDVTTLAAVTDSQAGTDADALRIKSGSSSKTKKVASEGQSFSVAGSQRVRYGADSRWVQKVVSGSGDCTNGFFGSDPAVGTVKSCELLTTAASGEVVVSAAPAPAPLPVEEPVASPAPAPEPAPVAAPPTAPAPAAPPVPSVTAWVRLAIEGEAFAARSQTVRFGDGLRWVTKVVSADGVCSRDYFGSDPAYGSGKFCEVQMTVPGVAQSGLLPVVNLALIPKAAKPFANPRVRSLSTAELANPDLRPAVSDIGDFREGCGISHMAADDPIVFPNKPGAAHMHTFFGNSQANASSTGDSLMSAGDSTCAGGTLNRTAYWMPTLIDIRTGQPMVPTGANFYYKQGYLGVKSGTMQVFPKGLRIVAGDSLNTNPISGFATRLECASGTGGHQLSMPSCPIGDSVVFTVVFPQCWDGVNLDSPDHKSHMAYATGGGCPSTHPVPLAEITMNVSYKVTETNTAAFWRLSSDDNAKPGGYSLHADWFNGWDPAISKTFVSECLNRAVDCHNHLLGDGRTLY